VVDVLPLPTLPAAPLGRKRRQPAPLTVDAKRLAKRLSVGVRTIRTWDSAGKLPAPVRVGGKVLWYLPEIREWIESGTPNRSTWVALKAARSK
jgi:predicted DNA-binding transcriptional regulator AlpA